MNARLPLEAPVRESELARFAAIARIAAAKGWGRYAERLGLGRHDHPGAGEEVKSDAVRLREALEELGPTFVKLGQMMAGRTDIFPEELVAELGKLHEAAASFPPQAARLERHLLHASNRLAFALIIAAIVVGSAIVIGAHAGPHMEGVPLLGIIGFVVAGALGIAWAVIALKSGKL
jgi:hypothetical protein